MNTLAYDPMAKEVFFDANHLWVELADGRKLGTPLTFFPRLLNATEKQRAGCIISGGGSGLHWEDIDEDICVKSLIFGIGDRTQ